MNNKLNQNVYHVVLAMWVCLFTNHRLPLLIGIFGVLASFVLLFMSTGTYDIVLWKRYAIEIQTVGLFQLYLTEEMFNHPPLMGILAWQFLEFASFSDVPFPIVFKFFPVLANIATAILLGVMWSKKIDARMGVWAFALFTWALSSVFVSAFHGNTDSVVVYFCMLSLYFLERKKYGIAGLVFTAALNIKIIPLLLVFPVMAGIRTKVGIQRFCLGALIGAVPFIITWGGVGWPFISNVFGYGSNVEPWGIQLMIFRFNPELFEVSSLVYNTIGKLTIFGSILSISIIGFKRHWDPAMMMAMAFLLFLIFAPGFGVQYTAYLVPFIFAVNIRWGFLYASLSGIFIGSIYFSFIQDVYPLYSYFYRFPEKSVLIGFLLWCLIVAIFIYFLLKSLNKR